MNPLIGDSEGGDSGRTEPALSEAALPTCFFAYPALPRDRAESLERAIERINAGQAVRARGWKSLTVTGKVIIGAICDAIKSTDIFVADITGLNPNVLFELGYAMAHKKRIWLLLNPYITRAKQDFDRFQLLSTVGYSPYSNSHDIVDAFYKEQPFQDLGRSLYDELLTSAGPPSKKDALLFLPCAVQTEASIRVSRRVSSGPIGSVIDDPQEMRTQPLTWYVQQANAAYAVVCHLLSTEYADWELHNAKHALVAGLAHGLAKPLLMLAHEPYVSPLDYRDLLRLHRTAATAETIFADWSLPYVQQYETRLARAAAYREEERARKELRYITIGEPVAEFESDSVPDYYVSTAVYTEALSSKYSILVGRKGTGKTAALFALAQELTADPRNHVCVIKPVAYELEGLLGILRQELSRAEQGYLVESFWKFLLYTELVKSVYDQLLAKPSYYVPTQAESTLCEFVEQNRSVITPEFSARLETLVVRLRDLPASEGRRLKVSELLHTEMLPRLRMLLGGALESKAKVAVLVDNLDKAWNGDGDLALLSDLLFGLLGVSRRVSEEFGRDASRRTPVNLSFVLFLRSDIYAAMLQFASERDKLPMRLITWEDAELLKRVIEKRLMQSDSAIGSADEVWERYFVPTVQGVPTWEYIAHRILPRPRDLIYLIKSSLQTAVNRGKTRVEEPEFVDGEKRYSRFALDSLIVEGSVRIPNVEDFLLQFVQSSEIIAETEIAEKLSAAKVAMPLEEVIDRFGQLTFLGFESAPNRFEFLHDEREARKIEAMARKTARETTNNIRRFRIHPAFHAFLEIKPHQSAHFGQYTIDLA